MVTPSTGAPTRAPREYLAVEVSQFQQKHKIPPSRFGREAMNDPRVAGDLFLGRIVRPETAARVRAYMVGRA